MKRASFIAVIAAFLLVLGGAPITAQSDGPLTHLTTDFVTGDAVVGGTSLFRAGINGLASRDINISGVPAGAELLSAYLYIQTTFRESFGEDAGMAGATFKGHSLNSPGVGPIPKALNWNAGTQACWSYGWNPRRRLVTYRADVLRFLDIDAATGKHVANGLHRVQVADAGRGNFRDDEEDSPSMTGPRAVGASLVLVYRHPNPLTPLRAIVIYDGGVTKRAFETISQRMQGFYQPAAVNPDAKMIHIVGDGQPFLSERVQFGAQAFPNNPFIGAKGLRWDNPTFNLGSALQTYPDASNLNTVTVSRNGLLSDCLSWSAIIVSTKVEDTDNDGLLDIWESSSSDIFDPDGQKLPNIQAMGADPNVKDLFVEIGALYTDRQITYGVGDSAKTKEAHSHFPSRKALDLVGDAFKNAPERINVHFDVGSNYQTDPVTNEVDPYIIRANLAKGGKTLSETEVCAADPSDPTSLLVDCLDQVPPLIPGQYPYHPGTVGWKTGYFFYRDKLLAFDSARKNIFRYAFFAHALGLPKSEDEFLADGTTPNPDFHTPKTSSGVADWAGGDVLVTLGSFDDNDGNPVGTDFMQASTLMHESGHNFGRRHGGDLFELNCKPQYLSVMNYLYQLRGLLDEQGVPHLNYNFAGAQAEALPEQSLTGGFFAATPLPYRLGWYVPKGGSYLKNLTGGAATKHCDGSELSEAEKADLLLPGGGMVRVDGLSVAGSIDWDADGIDDSVTQDVNFNGFLEDLGPGSDDWANLRLNQLGARRSIGGLFMDRLDRPTIGPLSLNAGKGDLGKGDLGKGDLGKGDLGKGDLGKGDLGKGDLGKGDLGKGDLGGSVVTLTLGKGDLGKGDLGRGDLDVGSGTPAEHPDIVPPSLTYEDAKAVTGGKPAPASGLQACLTSDGVCSTDGGDRPVRLAWLKPNEGEVLNYLIYRFEYSSETFEAPAVLSGEDQIGTVGAPLTTFVDSFAPAGRQLAYYVIAQYADDNSGISNFATIATPAPPAPILVPASLAFAQQPTSTVAARPITPAVTVRINDQFGNAIPGGPLQVTLDLGENPGDTSLSGTTTHDDDDDGLADGFVTFPNVSINRAGVGYTLIASSNSEALGTATSNLFNITSTGSILIYGPAFATTATTNEKTIAEGAGYTVVVKDAEEWGAMTTADFSLYKAIVFPDPSCVAGTAPLLTAENTREAWSPAVQGPKVVVGTDPVFHSNRVPATNGNAAAPTLTLNAINFAASGSGTGMYMSLSCYYFNVTDPTSVQVLSAFGEFTVQAQGPSAEQVHVIESGHPVMSGLTDTNMSNWGISVHEWFSAYPEGWTPLAEETSGDIPNRPYIIVKSGSIELR